MAQQNILLPYDKIQDICLANGIRPLSPFGSVLREDFHAVSDVDILIEFERGHRYSYIDKSRIRHALADIVGREVDLRTIKEFSPYIRERVLSEAELQYHSSSISGGMYS